MMTELKTYLIIGIFLIVFQKNLKAQLDNKTQFNKGEEIELAKVSKYKKVYPDTLHINYFITKDLNALRKEVSYTGYYIYYYDYKNKRKFIEGPYLNGQKHGKWITYYENGKKKVEENFVDGNKIGYYSIWSKKGDIVYEGNF